MSIISKIIYKFKKMSDVRTLQKIIEENKKEYYNMFPQEASKERFIYDEHFYPDNFKRFCDYVAEYYKKVNPKYDIAYLDTTITADDLIRMNGNQCFNRKVYLEVGDYQKAIVTNSKKFKWVKKTRCIPNRDLVLEMVCENEQFWEFNLNAFKDENIKNAISLFEKIIPYIKKSCVISEECMRFHPILFEFVIEEFDAIYGVYNRPNSGYDYFDLTPYGQKIMKISDCIYKQTKETRKYGLTL